MRIKTDNIKSLQYDVKHILYVGSQTGTFKRLNIANKNSFLEEKLQNIDVLSKDSKITCLEWGNDDETEILIGRANKFVKIFDTGTNESKCNLEMIDVPIVGLCRYNEVLVAGIGNGQIQILQDGPQPSIIKTGTHIDRLKQCIVDKKLVATGGKGEQNNLKLWDLNTKTLIFKTKNLPHDMVRLEIPVWDNDFIFHDDNALSTCSRYGYIRYYDRRAQRRPVLTFNDPDEQISFSSLSNHDRMLFVGTTTSGARAYDSRKLKHKVHTYKGFTGTITDVTVDSTGKYMYTSSLDRFVRTHSIEKPMLLYQCYVKSKATKILLKENAEATDSQLNIQIKKTIEDDECSIEENNESDTEYNELFDKMPIVDETEDSDNSIDEEEENDEEKEDINEEEESKEVITKKRKLI